MSRIDLLRNAIISMQWGLPYEYTLLEYLESDGPQYIDLDFIPYYDRGKTEIITESTHITGTLGIWGYVETGIIDNRVSVGISGGKWLAGAGYTNYADLAYVNQRVHMVFDRNNNTFTTNDTAVNTVMVPTTRARKNAYLFARHGGTDSTYGASYSGRIYRYKEYDKNDQLIIDMVPALHTATNVAGMYDLVRRKFFINSGTGTFNTSDVVEDYIRLEYIESTGTQWIDTKITNTGNYIFEGDFLLRDFVGTVGGDGVWIVGGRVSPNYALGLFAGVSIGMTYGYGDTTRPIALPKVLGDTWYHWYFTMNDLIMNGYVYTIVPGKLVPVEYETNMLLGKNQVNWAGTGDDPRNFKGYMKGMSILNADTMEPLRNFIPVQGTVTGNVGMLDTVHNVFYTSAGPDQFIAGPVL